MPSGITACPRCSSAVERLKINLDCEFDMCVNSECSFPFDSNDFVQYMHNLEGSSDVVKSTSKKRKNTAMSTSPAKKKHESSKNKNVIAIDLPTPPPSSTEMPVHFPFALEPNGIEFFEQFLDSVPQDHHTLNQQEMTVDKEIAGDDYLDARLAADLGLDPATYRTASEEATKEMEENENMLNEMSLEALLGTTFEMKDKVFGNFITDIEKVV
ncbi:uncharacterized protein VTP21DRAFT_9133 [Calcarisporiella thermophila]|uniref:uncharacterized protein n=1 Tax=Calcarisporiella thermophila TaxID=911321 RepID=UPI003742DC56